MADHQVVLGDQVPPSLVVEVFALGVIGPPGPDGPPGPEGPPGPTGPVDEAPLDGEFYGRTAGLWGRVLALQGGTMTGPIAFADDQVIDGGEYA